MNAFQFPTGRPGPLRESVRAHQTPFPDAQERWTPLLGASTRGRGRPLHISRGCSQRQEVVVATRSSPKYPRLTGDGVHTVSADDQANSFSKPRGVFCSLGILRTHGFGVRGLWARIKLLFASDPSHSYPGAIFWG